MCARLAVVVLLVLALPASAQAHAFLESSTPANGTSLGRAPHVVSLHFTEPVSAGLAHVQLFDGRGRQRAGVRVRGGRTASELVVSLPALANRRLPHHLLDCLAGRSPRHAWRDRLRRRRSGSRHPRRRRRDAPTSLTESVAHLLDLVALSILIAICGLLAGRLARSRARSRRALRRWSRCRPCCSQASWRSPARHRSCRCATVLAHTAWGHAMVVRELAIVAVAARGRDCGGPARSRPARAGRRSRGRERARGVARRRWPGARDDAAHPRGRPLGGRADRARARASRRRATRHPRDARPLRPAGRGERRPCSSSPASTAPAVRSRVSTPCSRRRTAGRSSAKLALLAVTGGLGLLGLRALRRARPSLRLLRAEAIGAVGILAAASLLLASAPARGPQFAPAPARHGHAARHGTGRRPPRRSLGRTQPAGAELRHAPRSSTPAPLARARAPGRGHLRTRFAPPDRDRRAARREPLAGRGHAALGSRRLEDLRRRRAPRPAAAPCTPRRGLSLLPWAQCPHGAPSSRNARSGRSSPRSRPGWWRWSCSPPAWRLGARLTLRRPRTA